MILKHFRFDRLSKLRIKTRINWAAVPNVDAAYPQRDHAEQKVANVLSRKPVNGQSTVAKVDGSATRDRQCDERSPPPSDTGAS